MSADVIQHTTLHRKRGNAWSWTTRHVVLLIVVVAGIIAASWLAPNLAAPPQVTPATAPETSARTAPPAGPDLAIVDVAADLASPPASVRRNRPTASPTGIPLDAAVAPRADYEILSAAELEGISQARN